MSNNVINTPNPSFVDIDPWGFSAEEEAQMRHEKEQKSVKRVLKPFFESKKFTSKAYSISMILTGALMLVGSLAFFVCWICTYVDRLIDLVHDFIGRVGDPNELFRFFSIQAHLPKYDYAVDSLLLIVAFSVIGLIFAIIMVVQLIRGISSLASSEHKVRIAPITTMTAFYLIAVFLERVFKDEVLTLTNRAVLPIFIILMLVALAYAVLRLLASDIKKRLPSAVCAFICVVLCIVMFAVNIGSVASFSIYDGFQNYRDVSLSSLGTFRYLCGAYYDTGEAEALFFESAVLTDYFGIYDDTVSIAFFLQFFPILIADLLPLAALSMLVYLLYVLTEREYVQYYYLKHVKRMTVMMLTALAISSACMTLLYYASVSSQLRFFSVEIDIANIIISGILCILMLVASWIPWRMYTSLYNKRCIEHDMLRKEER